MLKIALIIDKSQSYLNFEKNKVLEEWNSSDDIQYTTNFSSVGQSSLFGEPPVSVMQINDVDSIKKLFSNLEKEESDNMLQEKLVSGLVILTTVNRVSTKKLEALIQRNGGSVILAKTSAKDKTNVASKILSELCIASDVKKFLVEYVGDDYDSVISVAGALASLSETAQKRVTIEDMFLSMPQAPGSIPPWEVERPLMAGNVHATIENYRRITQSTHGLVVLSILKNKILLAYKIAAIISNNPEYTMPQIAKSLNVANNYPFQLASQLSKTHGLNKLEWVLMELLKVDAKIKGHSATDYQVEMEITLTQIANKMRP